MMMNERTDRYHLKNRNKSISNPTYAGSQTPAFTNSVHLLPSPPPIYLLPLDENIALAAMPDILPTLIPFKPPP